MSDLTPNLVEGLSVADTAAINDSLQHDIDTALGNDTTTKFIRYAEIIGGVLFIIVLFKALGKRG